jgi:CubicO group peptidase (beta-lactamase class C family)
VVLDAGYGLADRATQVPDGPGTIFQIGSVTKQFTAMAIAILAGQGRLQLTGRACGYLPGCPPTWRPITIAELLTPTPGMADWSAWRLADPLPGEAANPIAAIVTQAEREPLAFAPGTRAGYSNPSRDIIVVVLSNLDTVNINAISVRLNQLATAS